MIERKIVGALRSTIDAHGPITEERIGSAAKRVYGALYGKQAAPSPSTANREHHDELRMEGKAVIIRVGDRVAVKPSRPGKQDGWVGNVTQLYTDKSGQVAEVTWPGGAARAIPFSRIKSRKR